MKKFILGIAFLCITLITSLNAEVIIDVRTIDEYNSGHIENSLNIEWQAIDEINESIAKDEKIYLYCRSGNRSGKAQNILINMGYKDVINLELPLKYGTKISGHICQGHVDTVAKVLSIKKIDKSFIFDFEIPMKERKHLIEKASICVNGISLTISKVTKKGFQIWIIPHTYKETNLSKLNKYDLVNIEIDILSKYVRNYFYEKK